MSPYAPPQATLADPAQGPPGRPVMVWVICVFLGFGIVFGATSTIALLAGRPIGGQEAALATAHLKPMDPIFSLLMSGLSGLAVVALFRLKGSALPLFLAALGLGAASLLLNGLLRPEYRAVLDRAGLASLIIGWGINLAILAYVWRLRTRGVLRA
jgi:hypothetical protein